MRSSRTKAEKLKLLLKKELNNPKISVIKKSYLKVKIKLLNEFLIKKGK